MVLPAGSDDLTCRFYNSFNYQKSQCYILISTVFNGDHGLLPLFFAVFLVMRVDSLCNLLRNVKNEFKLFFVFSYKQMHILIQVSYQIPPIFKSGIRVIVVDNPQSTHIHLYTLTLRCKHTCACTPTQIHSHMHSHIYTLMYLP